jgi:hypothetical protein
MSTRYEGAEASAVGIEFAKPLDEIGEDTLEAGKYALIIGYDEVFFVTGTPRELIEFAENALEHAKEAFVHSQSTLTMGDIGVDEDGFFTCPRCEKLFEPGEFDSLGELIDAARKHIDAHNSKPKEALL